MGNINTQFRNLRVDNLIRTAELRPSKTAAHFRNTLGLLRGFDKFRIGIFVFPVHILCCAAPIRTGITGTKIRGVAITPWRNFFYCVISRIAETTKLQYSQYLFQFDFNVDSVLFPSAAGYSLPFCLLMATHPNL